VLVLSGGVNSLMTRFAYSTQVMNEAEKWNSEQTELKQLIRRLHRVLCIDKTVVVLVVTVVRASIHES